MGPRSGRSTTAFEAMPRVYWLPIGPWRTSSARIHCYRVHRFLRRRGWDSRLLHRPRDWQWDSPLTGDDLPEVEPGDVVICQKMRGPRMVSLLAALRSRAVRTVYLDCDWPLKLNEARLAWQVVCASRFLAEEYARQGIANVTWIPDAYEWERRVQRDGSGIRLRGVWFGNATRRRLAEVEALRQLIHESTDGWTLVTISDHYAADMPWDLRTAPKIIAGCDFAVIPGSDEIGGFAKSSNRAIQAMALSLPVLAYPIPSYCDVIRNGRNGFLCRTVDDWRCALQAIADPALRDRVAYTGYRYARRYFSMARVGSLWEKLLRL
jgi:glycosyltransferase involved in cell wall biosynthesis